VVNPLYLPQGSKQCQGGPAARSCAAIAAPRGAIYDPRTMRRALRWVNVLAAAAPLASALAVLGSTLSTPEYRSHYRDSLPVVAAYIAFYLAVVVAFARDTRYVPTLAVLKAVGAYAFIAAFVVLGPLWMARTPGRYVYLLFDWGPEGRVVLIAFVMLGRGVWNTLNAMFFTVRWWVSLRQRQPLLGRIVTMLPLGITVALVAAFVELRKLDRQMYSPDAYVVARQVFDRLTCDEIRAKQGTETTDVRQRDADRFVVRIHWDCRAVRVLVQAPDERVGHADGERAECCAGGGP